MMDFVTLARERYSCRKLAETPVEKEKIEKILEAGNTAPTAVNKQPYRIWVMESEEARDKIAAVTPYLFGAKVFFVVGYHAEEAWVREFDGKNFAEVDASIVATHMMLAVQDLGLGTTWVGHFDAPKLQELCPEMKDYELIAIFPVGYPAADALPGRSHSRKKGQDEMVSFL